MLIFVDSVDLAEVEAVRYAKGLKADELTAVHFVLDSAHAERLQAAMAALRARQLSCGWSIASTAT